MRHPETLAAEAWMAYRGLDSTTCCCSFAKAEICEESRPSVVQGGTSFSAVDSPEETDFEQADIDSSSSDSVRRCIIDCIISTLELSMPDFKTAFFIK